MYPVPFTTMSVLDTGSAIVMESVSHTLRAGGVPNVDTFDLILGNYAGPIGATSVLILVACAMYLWMRRTSRWASLSVFCSPARWWRFFTRV